MLFFAILCAHYYYQMNVLTFVCHFVALLPCCLVRFNSTSIENDRHATLSLDTAERTEVDISTLSHIILD